MKKFKTSKKTSAQKCVMFSAMFNAGHVFFKFDDVTILRKSN